MKKIKNGFAFVLLISLTLSLYASGIKYKTLMKSQVDPNLVFKSGARIGIVPRYWTIEGKKNNIDPLTEKVILNYFKKELEARKAQVKIIPLENIRELEYDNITFVDLKESFDYMFGCSFSEISDVANMPSQTAAYIGPTGGVLGSTGAQTVTIWGLNIGCSLYAGDPAQVVWRAEILKGSPLPNLTEHAPKMIADLFKKKFLKN